METPKLKRGEYSVKVDGSQALIIDNKGQQIDVTAKVEPGERKFSLTSVFTSKEDGTARIQRIELGGSRNVVIFE